MAHSSQGQSVLSRIMRILGAFDADTASLTLTGISQRTGLSPASTHRLTAELVSFGLLERQTDKTFRIGVRLWEIACLTPGALGLRELAMPHLQDVHATVGQHTQLGILEGHEVLFLERLSARESVINVTLIGGRLPLHASSSGLVLLANGSVELQEQLLAAPLPRLTAATITDPAELRRTLARIRREGFIACNGFIHPAARGLAVPVQGLNGTVIAALSVVVPNDGTPVQRTVRTLQLAAARISADFQAAYRPAGEQRAGERQTGDQRAAGPDTGHHPGSRQRRLVSASLEAMTDGRPDR